MSDIKNIECGIEEGIKRLFIRITRDTLPRIADKYPFLYLERGRLEVDDSSVRWIDCAKNCVRIPVATIACLLLGPGTTVTHEAVKTASAANCMCAGSARIVCCFMRQVLHPLPIREICRGRPCCQ